MAKPYINVYVDAYAVKNQQRTYVFKNFGQTPAYIDNIQIDGELDSLNSMHRFNSLIGNMIAPGQKITSSIHPDYKGRIVITIAYSDTKKRKYTDNFVLDANLASSMLYTVNEILQLQLSDNRPWLYYAIYDRTISERFYSSNIT